MTANYKISSGSSRAIINFADILDKIIHTLHKGRLVSCWTEV